MKKRNITHRMNEDRHESAHRNADDHTGGAGQCDESSMATECWRTRCWLNASSIDAQTG
jgi:hypothetical protein